jgi:type IV secretory pathway TrbF-like protein
MAANPYVEAHREWDERYADLVLGKRNWQIAAGGLLAVSLILAGGIVWLSTRSRYVPYVVEVDKLGYALTVPQRLTPASVPDVTTRIERYEVASFIRDARAGAAIRKSSSRCSIPCSGTRAARRIDSSMRTITPTASPTTPSSSPRD